MENSNNEKPINNTKIAIVTPIIVFLSLAIGIYIGAHLSFAPKFSGETFKLPSRKFDKINTLMQYIDQEYVDEVDRKQIEEKVINKILAELDPHSQYISPEEMAEATEPLEGNFEGIGVEFNIQNDTITVVKPVADGPSAKVGILAGDRIVKVDNKNVAGVKISNNDVMRLLKGPKNSVVKVEIKRRGKKNLLPFIIKRGTIPIKSVDAAFMIDTEIGYVNVIRFAKTSHSEFVNAVDSLLEKGCKKLIIDLRGNGGGLLDVAVQMIDEFLTKGEIIVYTEGKSQPRKNYFAKSGGKYENIQTSIIIDEGSASASEIFAGAMQDNDKAWIVGRRSFGKGLVQEQNIWPDGSALRLTVSRYYTPSGRSIQKPYNKTEKEYDNDLTMRFNHGELFHQDSIVFHDSLAFKTKKGRKVYGGGGIMPDYFVPFDTAGTNEFFTLISYGGLINQFAFQYVDNNRAKFKHYTLNDFANNFQINETIEKAFEKYLTNNGIPFDEKQYKNAKQKFHLRIKAYLARQFWGGNGYYKIMSTADASVLKSVSLLKDQKSTL